MSCLTGEDTVTLVAVGCVAGVAPDYDLLLARITQRVHRSVASHSLLAAVALSCCWAAILLILRYEYLSSVLDMRYISSSALVVFMSAFMHAAEDSLTMAGCILFYPISKRRWTGPVRYDDFAANAILSAVAVLAIVACAGYL